MADFLVALLSTSIILLLSYLFWKWHTKRKSLANEREKKPVLSRGDMLRNRLKRFETRGFDDDDDDRSPIKNQSKHTSKDIAENQGLQTQEDLELDRINLPGKLNTPNSGPGNEGLAGQSSVNKPASKNKPANSRKWVRLSTSDSNDKSIPVTQPLTNLDELLGWTEGYDGLNVSSVPLARVGSSLEQRRRTIVCHDMKGGYVQDRFVQGYLSTECYRIYHWQYIDIFIYFSHNFVTIPPPCWTNAAHKHGVLMLGTFITEWEDGTTRCSKIFKDQLSYRQVADQLVFVAKYYGFDGWLINIENPIQPAQMNNLVEFVTYLTDQMHKTMPSSLVIWYDSVTYMGELKWQNKLNADNRVFFDVSDGIFLNYGWNQTDLALSARAAGPDRRYDVYVGVDVFGRGVYGGGGWNTNKATHLIKENDLSVALFAPGWVYEKYESTFKTSQDKFWTSIAPDCTIHALGPCLPFLTSFCQGYGEKWFSYGEVALDQPWTHLSAQELQPSYINQIYTLGAEPNGILITTADHQIQDSYRGGGCLTLQGSTKITTSSCKAVVRLFNTDIQLPSTVLVSYTIKVEDSNLLDIALQLHVDKKPNYIILPPLDEEHSQDSQTMDSLNEALVHRYGVPRSDQIDSTCWASLSVGQEHYRSFAPVTGQYHKKLAEMCGDGDRSVDSSWQTRYYLLAEKDLKGSHIKGIRLVLMNKTISGSKDGTSSTPFQLYLGEVKMIDAVSLRQPLPTVTSLKCIESEIKCHTVNSNTLAITLTLSWTYDRSNTEPYQRFQIYHLAADGSTVFLGLAYSTSYVVTEMALPRSQEEAQFIVQAVSCSQRKQALSNCPCITVYWS